MNLFVQLLEDLLLGAVIHASRNVNGHISKEGSVWLRWVLCEAAQTAKRSPEFAPAFQRIAKRRGKKIATTAIARKLAARAWHLLAEADQAAAPQPATPQTTAR